jgi:hypothetical protein
LQQLEKSKFKLRTALGESQETYEHTEDTPINGMGQGTCASPAIWLMLSSFLMDIFESKANGMIMYDILRKNKVIRQFIEAFVDDASSFTTTEFGEISIAKLFKKCKPMVSYGRNYSRHLGMNWNCQSASITNYPGNGKRKETPNQQLLAITKTIS